MQSIIDSTFFTFKQLKIEEENQISSLPNGIKPFLLAYLFKQHEKPLIFVLKDNFTAQELEESLIQLGIPTFSLLDFDILPYEEENISFFIRKKRMEFFIALLEKQKGMYLVPLKSYLFSTPPLKEILNRTLNLQVGQKIPRKTLENTLIQGGYTRLPHVENPGDCAFRGEVVDIFPFHLEHPIRIDFFDDEIEKIRSFSQTTQTSFQQSNITNMMIYPLYEFMAHDSKMQEAFKKLALDYPPLLLEQFKESLKQENPNIHLLPFIYPKNFVPSLFQEINLDFFLILEEKETLLSVEKTFSRDVKEMYYTHFNANKIKVLPKDYFTPLEDIPHPPHLEFSMPGQGFSLAKTFAPAPLYRGRLELFKEHLKEWESYHIVLGCSYKEQQKRIKDIFPNLKSIQTGFLKEGFLNHHNKTVLILEGEIFGKKHYSARKKNILLSSSPIESFSDLERGDFVVHINHGIGRYEGIEKISALGKYKDYVKLSYANENTLYVPVEQIFMLHKYLGGENFTPRLDSLGGKAWEKRKEKIKAEMEKIAQDLALLYEKRNQLHGYAYPADSLWQQEFEAGFPYEETPDQLKAIQEVKKDMESPLPMDRLICGDVGYGKTEVAMRAAFKAVASGKQVAILAPTTLLAEQHSQNFYSRFENFALSIKMLSRFVSPSQTKKIIEDLKGGKVDILIGTHKILSDKVVFKDLGLLVIDEEQRFGVKHKEKIKQIKSNVDVLTLSATPIPRTLYMGLSSLRNMSLITTPPASRIPIKTYVMPFTEHILIQAIKRELERKGQVFIVHNRVKTIHQFASYVQQLIPQAKIAVGHAQMPSYEMEDVFLDFISGQYDVLVSTTIIENGIDIPNANTIIIDKPELLGLAELYQLRGRVGRSHQQAYAYLFYNPHQGLSHNVQRRLEVIEENTDLGSGFKIAMKDLEIRGAGNILGKSQSGFIADVGIELYTKMMKKAVEQAKAEIKEEELEPLLDLSFSGYIPENYIFEEKERFSIYKMIMRASFLEEITDLEKQIQDRYGKVPPTVHNLIKVSSIKMLCKKLRILELKEDNKGFALKFLDNQGLDSTALAHLISLGKAKILSADNLYFYKNQLFHENEDFLEILKTILISLLKKSQEK